MIRSIQLRHTNLCIQGARISTIHVHHSLSCVPLRQYRACVIDSLGLGITCVLYHSTMSTRHPDFVSFAIPIFHIIILMYLYYQYQTSSTLYIVEMLHLTPGSLVQHYCSAALQLVLHIFCPPQTPQHGSHE